ncbi:MAG: VOC family protein [Myxococcales bacterium FL481]|nr:MAG: VOC family protein [Myxococcales bacterium FL481]
MNETPESIISHVSIGTHDLDASTAFYDTVLPTVGAQRILEHPGAVAYGRQLPEFWVQTPIDGKPANVGNGSHFAFIADSPAQVDAFFRAALEAGAEPDGDPGPRPAYGAGYYGCFVRDPDGHKIEATYYDLSQL